MEKKRFLPLDIMRGLTVLFMIIVNNPGSYVFRYPVLCHSPWNGCTPTDLVYPFFLFCVGASMAFSLARYDGLQRRAVGKILRRTVLIFLVGIALGIICSGSIKNIRIFGVLQRIALSYCLAAFVVLWLKTPRRIGLAGICLGILYTAILLVFGDKGAQFTLEGNFAGRLDVTLVGTGHVYNGYGIPFDPEGLLGTLTGACTAIIGYLVGNHFRSREDDLQSVFAYGLLCLAAAEILSIWIPLNKPLWSVSYVLYAGGWAMLLLALTAFLVNVRGYGRFFEPARAFGCNALAMYVLSHLISIPLLAAFPGIRDFCTTPFLSLCYALGYMLVNLAVAWLLYKKKIFIKL